MTIVRNLKKNLGEKGYQELVENRNSQKEDSNHEINNELIKNSLINNAKNTNEDESIEDYSKDREMISKNAFETVKNNYSLEKFIEDELVELNEI